MLPGPNGFSDLSRMPSPGHVLRPDCFLDAVYFLLIAFPIPRSIFLRFFQCRFQSFHSLGCSSQSLLQLGKFAAKICIITYQLFVHFRELFKIVLQEGDFLLLRSTASSVIRIDLGALLNSGCQVLNKELTQVV